MQVPEGLGAKQGGPEETLWLWQEPLEPCDKQTPQWPGQTQGGWCWSSVWVWT